MPQIAPSCAGCRSTEKLDRLYKRVYRTDDKSGKLVAFGWSCSICGSIRLDVGVQAYAHKEIVHWVYKGKYQ